MVFLQRILLYAARRVASDPRTREKAAEMYQNEIKPRAEAAWRETKPKIERAAEGAKAELRDIAAETDPRREPARFAGRLARRIIDKVKGE
jgi:hypothetical protein